MTIAMYGTSPPKSLVGVGRNAGTGCEWFAGNTAPVRSAPAMTPGLAGQIDGGEVHQADAPAKPSSLAIVFIASMQNAMCSSRSTPRSAAPLMMSSRLTLRAKALSFIFLRTDLASTSASDLLGLTSAEAVMKPEISSQA